jgi:hypothetical protein
MPTLAEAMAYVRELGLDALVAIGGDGTMTIAHRFEAMGLPVVGVPKTIDNDLCHTERTFGFDSAVAVVAEALDRLETTARSHGRVMIAETMGRYAGWIALEGGMAGGADVILMPEVPFDVEAVAAFCRRREAQPGHADLHRRRRARCRAGLTVRATLAPTAPIRCAWAVWATGCSTSCSPCCAAKCAPRCWAHVQRGGSPTPTTACWPRASATTRRSW